MSVTENEEVKDNELEEPNEEVVLTKKEMLIAKQVRFMLGSSVVKVEINEKEVKSLIDTALMIASPYITDYRYITKPFNHFIDLSDEGVEEVLRIMPSYDYGYSTDQGEEYLFDFTSWKVADNMFSTLDSVVDMMKRKIAPDVDIPFEFDANTKVLMPRCGAVSGDITMECIPEVYTIEDVRDKAMFKWIYLYTLALAKEVVGRIRSKAKSPNIPIELDGDTLLSEAASEKSVLESSLMGDQTGPIAILR